MEKKLVVLTGAGISAESGLRTFRGNDGMWEHENIEAGKRLDYDFNVDDI